MSEQIADIVDYQVLGDDLQIVEVGLDPGEGMRAEVGAMIYMGDAIHMDVSSEGGFFGGLKRAFAGESFFITNFYNKGSKKDKVAFAAPYPGQILPIDLKEFGGALTCQKDSYLCSAAGIDIDVVLTKRLGAGFFGGEGFILQQLKGDGMAFIHGGGYILKRELERGEILRVDTGCVMAFTKEVEYDIQMMQGFKNLLFGGEGLFLATLRGPGTVYVQSLPLSKLSSRILAHYNPPSS